ncbi:UNVERIFIED_CONTAM: hypothetical protein Slati_4303900 [Sesamum latifolium]|uniref:Uncharacterized protein n=1 Tax=Sesamum latifolium TaxID=2727402 RepID=A0AAW2TDC0_9LAMI
MAAGAGGSLEGPSGRSAGASCFFSSVFPSSETPPSEESIAAAGADVSLLPPPHREGCRDHPLSKRNE